MPTNLLKTYPQLLEIAHLDERQRTQSLRKVFDRDFVPNGQLKFRGKIIRPIKGVDADPDMEILFRHLTTEESEKTENGMTFKSRHFEMDRSCRLHWIKHLIEEQKAAGVKVFSVEERDQKKRQDIIRTYIYDTEEKYVIVLDPQRSQTDYYLVTAFYLNKDYGEKMMEKLMKKKLPDVH